MTDEVDDDGASVPIATYAYRHEAEFAAGFLEDAGIAYRLQVDDAAMTMSMGASATLWVRGIDLPRARDVLELPAGETIGTLARPRDAEPRPATRPRPRIAGPSDANGRRSFVGRTFAWIRALLRALSGHA